MLREQLQELADKDVPLDVFEGKKPPSTYGNGAPLSEHDRALLNKAITARTIFRNTCKNVALAIRAVDLLKGANTQTGKSPGSSATSERVTTKAQDAVAFPTATFDFNLGSSTIKFGENVQVAMPKFAFCSNAFGSPFAPAETPVSASPLDNSVFSSVAEAATENNEEVVDSSTPPQAANGPIDETRTPGPEPIASSSSGNDLAVSSVPKTLAPAHMDAYPIVPEASTPAALVEAAEASAESDASVDAGPAVACELPDSSIDAHASLPLETAEVDLPKAEVVDAEDVASSKSAQKQVSPKQQEMYADLAAAAAINLPPSPALSPVLPTLDATKVDVAKGSGRLQDDDAPTEQADASATDNEEIVPGKKSEISLSPIQAIKSKLLDVEAAVYRPPDLNMLAITALKKTLEKLQAARLLREANRQERRSEPQQLLAASNLRVPAAENEINAIKGNTMAITKAKPNNASRIPVAVWRLRMTKAVEKVANKKNDPMAHQRAKAVTIGMYSLNEFLLELRDSSPGKSSKYNIIIAFNKLAVREATALGSKVATRISSAVSASTHRDAAKSIKLGGISLSQFLKTVKFESNGYIASHAAVAVAFQKCSR
jgi:hypothetical protein